MTVFAIVAGAFASTALADTIKVGNGDDLQAAIDGAAAGDKIVGPTDDGIEVTEGSHVVSGNKVSKAGDVGIRVGTGGNEVTSNKVGGSDTVEVTGRRRGHDSSSFPALVGESP
jgi:hypothetical protein